MKTVIIQWNINGTLSKLSELRQLITAYHPLIICLQETRFKPKHQFSL